MDKRWVHLDRRSPEYYAGLQKFLDDSPKSVPENEIVCPCIKCKNRDKFDRRTVEQHLVVNGMWPFYMNTLWKEHGESYAEYSDHMELENDDGVEITGMQEFLNETFVQPSIGETVGSSNQPHIFEGPTPEAEMFYKLLEEANKEVYPGCKKFKKLEAIVRLYQLKCLGGMSDNIFSKLLEFIKELLPEGECLPESFYQTKKLINELGLTYEKIDACPNDCMLFWKDDKELEFCKHCQTSRYIEKEPSISEDLLWLANGPRKTVTRYNNHIVNGFRFRIKSIDDRKKNQNCGVFYTAATPCYSSASDRNPRVGDVDYYGVIKNIYELHYRGPTEATDMGRNVVLFDCEWVDSTCERGKKIDQYGFTLVNFKEVLHTEDTFVLASSAIQTFYVNDPVDPNWNVAVVTQPRDFYDVVAEDDASVTLENPLNAADHYAIPELDDHFMDSEEPDTRLDVEGIHVDQVLPDLNDMMELDSDDDLSTEDEDEDDLYDDMEY